MFVVLLGAFSGYIFLQNLKLFTKKDSTRQVYNVRESIKKIQPHPFLQEVKNFYPEVLWSDPIKKEYAEYSYFDVVTQKEEPYLKTVGYEIETDFQGEDLYHKVIEFFDKKFESDGWHGNLSADKAGGGYGSSIFGNGKGDEQFIFHTESYCPFDEEKGPLIGICSFSLKIFYGKKSFTQEKSIKNCSYIQDKDKRLWCILKQKISTQDISECNSMDELEFRENCKMNISALLNTENICQTLIENDGQEICYIILAQIKTDYSLCENIENKNFQEWCSTLAYFEEARIKKDVKICDNIIHKQVAPSCYNAILDARPDIVSEKYLPYYYHDYNIKPFYRILECERNIDNEYNKEKCYELQAERLGDSLLCDNLKNIDRRDRCLYSFVKENPDITLCERMFDGISCYISVAVKKQDVKICDLIKVQDEVSSCKRSLLFSQGKIESCETAKDYEKDNCFYLLAKQLNDPKICQRVENSFTRNTCYNEGALDTLNPLFCQSIVNDLSRIYGCLTDVAYSLDDPDICDKILNPEQLEKCYFHFAETRKDISFCERVGDEYYRNICFRDFSILIRDERICEKISEKDVQGDCYYAQAVTRAEQEICLKIQDISLQERCIKELQY